MKKNIRNIFSENLRKTRIMKDFSQADLAYIAGFKVTAISHFETGRRMPSLENLVKLSDGLECSIDFLLGRNN
jgi:transcriptional regulator with XRE-family HTH domain